MTEPAPAGWTMPEKFPRPRFGLKLSTMLGMIAVLALGYLGVREYQSPARVWRRASHATLTRNQAWVELEREHLIDGLGREATIAEVFEAMNDPDSEIRGWAVWCAPSVEADPLSLIVRLAGKLDDPLVLIRSKVAEALGRIVKRGGPGREEALFALSKALNDSDAGVRKMAIGSVGQVIYEGGNASDPLRSGRVDDPALKLVAARLADDDMAVTVEAALVLACNDRGDEAIPILTKFLKQQPTPDSLSYVADRAFLALTIASIRSSSAANFLVAEMTVPREGYPERPRDALCWSARQSPDSEARVRRLANAALKSDNLILRYNSAFLLHEIGSGLLALGVLIEALGDSSVEIRLRAVDALADLGEVDPRIIPALQMATNDPDVKVREQAAWTLEAIEWDKIIQ